MMVPQQFQANLAVDLFLPDQQSFLLFLQRRIDARDSLLVFLGSDVQFALLETAPVMLV